MKWNGRCRYCVIWGFCLSASFFSRWFRGDCFAGVVVVVVAVALDLYIRTVLWKHVDLNREMDTDGLEYG